MMESAFGSELPVPILNVSRNQLQVPFVRLIRVGMRHVSVCRDIRRLITAIVLTLTNAIIQIHITTVHKDKTALIQSVHTDVIGKKLKLRRLSESLSLFEKQH